MNRRVFFKRLLGSAFLGSLLYGVRSAASRYEICTTAIRAGSICPEPLCIVQLSDLHLRGIGAEHEEIAEDIRRLSPDLLVITGDMINEAHEIHFLKEFIALLPECPGMFAIPGNWEYWSLAGIETIRATCDKAGLRFLRNEMAELAIKGHRLLVAGVDDWLVGKPQLPHSQAKEGIFRILLSHCPGFRDTGEAAFYDLQLSGHTHGGQVNLFGWVPFLPRGSGRYVAGLYQKTNPLLYVSRGIGTTGLPIRFGARPEIAVLKIFC